MLCFPALLSGSPQVALERSEEHLVLSHVTCAGDSMLSGQPAGSFGLCLADGLAYGAAMPFLLLFFMLLTDGLWGILEDAGSYGKQEQEAAGIKGKRFIYSCFSCWYGDVLLAVYPGFFVYDAQDEFNQVAMRRFTTHHPLLHVGASGRIVSLGNKIFASYNAGIALYGFQMLLMAGCFTYILSYFRQNRAPVCVASQGRRAVFRFFPVIQMYVLCSAKDTLYSAGMLLTIVLLLRLSGRKQSFWGSEKMVLLLLALFSMAAMRHNGFYILLLMIPVIILCAGKTAG